MTNLQHLLIAQKHIMKVSKCDNPIFNDSIQILKDVITGLTLCCVTDVDFIKSLEKL